MGNDQEAIYFLNEFGKKNDMKSRIEFCEANRKIGNHEIRVLSTALLGILNEIKEYLNCYEEQIEKGFGVKTSSEMKRIENEVFEGFYKIINGNEIKTPEKRLEVLSNFINSWIKFKKEKIDTILET